MAMVNFHCFFAFYPIYPLAVKFSSSCSAEAIPLHHAVCVARLIKLECRGRIIVRGFFAIDRCTLPIGIMVESCFLVYSSNKIC
jgi:hypothetical protein